MKRNIEILLSILCILSLVGCNKGVETTYIEGIMVDGLLYEKLYAMPAEIDESAIIGYVESYTNTIPEKDGETNISEDLIGAPYAKVEGGIALLHENEWYLCTAETSDDISLVPAESEETEATKWSIQEIEALFLAKAESDWKFIKCVEAYDFAYERVGVVLYIENDTEYVNIAFMDEDGIMPHCGIEAVLDENIEFTYHGNGEVTFNVCSKDGMKYKQKIVFSKYDDEINFVSESLK